MNFNNSKIILLICVGLLINSIFAKSFQKAEMNSLNPLKIAENNDKINNLHRNIRGIKQEFLINVAASVTSGLIIEYHKEIYVIAKNGAGEIVGVGKQVGNKIINVATNLAPEIINYGNKIGEITENALKKFRNSNKYLSGVILTIG